MTKRNQPLSVLHQIPGLRSCFVVLSSHPGLMVPTRSLFVRFVLTFFIPCASVFPPFGHLEVLLQEPICKTVGACARSSMIPLLSVAPCGRSCRIECTISGFCQHKSLLIFPLMWPDFPRLANLFQDHNPNSDWEIFHFFTFRQLII